MMPAIPRKTSPPTPPVTPRLPPPPPPRNHAQKPALPRRRRPVPETVYISSPSNIYLNLSEAKNGTCSNVLGACLGQGACIKTQKACFKPQEAWLNENRASSRWKPSENAQEWLNNNRIYPGLKNSCYNSPETCSCIGKSQEVWFDPLEASQTSRHAQKTCLAPHGAWFHPNDACKTARKVGVGAQEAWFDPYEACQTAGHARKACFSAQEACDSGHCTGESVPGGSEGLYINGSCDSGVVSDSGNKLCCRHGFNKGEAKLRGVEVKNGVESQEMSIFIGKICVFIIFITYTSLNKTHYFY